MATAKVACITSITQVPHTCPAITQHELAHLLEMRRQRDALDKQIQNAEASARAALESGAEVEAGVFHARLKITERRSVQWKAIVERELGEDYARRVLSATHPDTFTTLVVGA